MSAPARCPVCAGNGPFAPAGFHKEYELYDCAACGVGFAWPFKNPGPEFYEHNTDMYPKEVQTATDPFSYEYDEGLAILTRTLAKGARVLDIGCGGGGFLHRGKAAGFAMTGVDFNPARAALLQQAGYDVLRGGLLDFARSRPSARFEAITMFEVLEHLDDPAGWLAAARHLLTADGILVVGTPNRRRRFDQFQAPGMEEIDLPPHHLSRWTEPALRGFLAARGLEVMECRALGYPRALLGLMLRNGLRLGMATKALKVDQLQHASTETAGIKTGIVKSLVAIKSGLIEMLSFLFFPFFRLAMRAKGWEGPILLAAARRPK